MTKARTMADRTEDELTDLVARLGRLEARAAEENWQDHREAYAGLRASAEAELQRGCASS